MTALWRLSPAPPEAPPPTASPTTPEPPPIAPPNVTPPPFRPTNPHPVHVFEDPPPPRVALGLDAGAAFHSFPGVPIWGGYGALLVGGILQPVTLAFRSTLFAGNTPGQLSYLQLDGGVLVDTHLRRVHLGIEPFVGYLQVSRATRTTGSVTGPLVGVALSLGADLVTVGRGTLRIDLTGKVASAGEDADTWEVTLGLGCRLEL